MRITPNLSDDAMLTAQSNAGRLPTSLDEAASRFIGNTSAPQDGKFALAPKRNEVITTQYVRELMDGETFI